jgi:hypothetical protein
MARSKQVLPGGTRTADFVSLGVLSQRLPRELIAGVVREAGRSSIRHRDLPAELVVLYCLCLWLYRDVAYEDVLQCLLESWRWLDLPDWKVSSKGAITQARLRLGEEPMRMLFEQVAKPLAGVDTQGAWYRGLRIVAVDGTLMDTPDTAENSEAFGKPTNQTGPGPFPKVRVLALTEVSTHAPLGCAIGSYFTSEVALLKTLVPKITPEMLLIVDRCFFGPEIWQECSATGAMLLWRIRKNVEVKIQERLKDGSYRALAGSTQIPVRLVSYKVEGSDDEVRLLTNMLEPDHAPAIELARLYPQRWEAELVFDEIKSHMSEARLSVRSKKPELVKQEIWGLMLLHWALRDIMHQAAIAHARDPDTISFVKTVRLVKFHLGKDGNFSP